MVYYVYGLVDPRNNKVFYIGKGKNHRMFDHVEIIKKGYISNNNNYLTRKIKHILEEYEDIAYIKFFESENEKECFNKEKELIKEYGRENLCNMTDGGDGILNGNEEIYKKIGDGNRYKVQSDITKARMSEAQKGEKNGFYGKKHTEETKKKISDSCKGLPSSFKNKHHKEYSNLKNRISHLGKPAWNKNIPMSEEAKQKLSESKKGKTPWNKGKELIREEECQICHLKFKTITNQHCIKKHQITKQQYKEKYAIPK